jgi:hypothetical protein
MINAWQNARRILRQGKPAPDIVKVVIADQRCIIAISMAIARTSRDAHVQMRANAAFSMSAFGTSRHFAALRNFVAIGE